MVGQKKNPKNPHAVALVRLRHRKLTPERRSEIAAMGARARNEALSSADKKRISRMGVRARQAKRKQRGK